MPPPASLPESTDLRILDMAARHLRQFGPARTTVSAIAADVGMTHANVYRYFSSKAALVDAVSAHWLRPLEVRLIDIAQSPDPAQDKLERMAVEIHRIYRDRVEAEPVLYDLFLSAVIDGRGVARQHRRRVQSAILRVVEEGIASRTFPADEPRKALAFVFDALHRFIHPQSVGMDRDTPRHTMELRFSRVLRSAMRSLVAGRL